MKLLKRNMKHIQHLNVSVSKLELKSEKVKSKQIKTKTKKKLCATNFGFFFFEAMV